ncbi:MAG: hypothetical protein HC848_09600 [Limnobacter sp.]|nr:hypothetical protein [Limnobacter sp.]
MHARCGGMKRLLRLLGCFLCVCALLLLAVRFGRVGLAEFVFKPAVAEIPQVYSRHAMDRQNSIANINNGAQWLEVCSRIERAIALDPTQARYYRWLGLAYLARSGVAAAGSGLWMQFVGQAGQAFEEALKHNPAYVYALGDLLITKNLLRQYDAQTVYLLHQLLQLGPREVALHQSVLLAYLPQFEWLGEAVQQAVLGVWEQALAVNQTRLNLVLGDAARRAGACGFSGKGKTVQQWHPQVCARITFPVQQFTKLQCKRGFSVSTLLRAFFWVIPLALASCGLFAGGELVWAQACTAILVCLGLIGALLAIAAGVLPVPKPSRWQLCFLAALLALALLFEVQGSQVWGWSVFKADTVRQALVTWVYLAFSVLCMLLVRTRSQVYTVLWALLLIAVVQALLGMVLVSATSGYWLRGDFNAYTSVKGTFFNKNNFAAFMNLAVFSGLGLVLLKVLNARSFKSRGLMRFFAMVQQAQQNGLALLVLLVLVCVIAIALSKSRAAAGLCALGFLGWSAGVVWLFSGVSGRVVRFSKRVLVGALVVEVFVLIGSGCLECRFWPDRAKAVV